MDTPSYIAVEGVTGVGKTRFARLLAAQLGAKLILEETEGNPFLHNFYQDMRRYAFPTEVYFLLQRHKQQVALPQRDLFHHLTVSDYLFARNRIFTNLTLDESELKLYENLLFVLEKDITKPDVVIYLQASTDRLIERVFQRGHALDQGITDEYIRTLNEMYNRFFLHYWETPLLIVNANDYDSLCHETNIATVVELIQQPRFGTEYYIPHGRDVSALELPS